jgi:hypothetical protein
VIYSLNCLFLCVPYLPVITDYLPFYIQIEGEETANDTAQVWGFLLKSSPYPVFPNPKEKFSVDWKDEDGVDEQGGAQMLSSIDFSVDFLLLTKDRNNLSSQTQTRQMIGRFVDAVRGGYFSVYDAYTGIGLRKVRYVGYTPGVYWCDGHRTGDIFSVQMCCDDPTARMMLSNGAIVPYSSAAVLPEPYSPTISGYKPFYIQPESGSTATDTKAAWGLVAKSDPVPVMPNAKEPFREKTPQENGDMGFAAVRLQPIDFRAHFFIKAYDSAPLSAQEILLSRLLAFRTLLTSDRLLVLDSYTDFGKAKVRYAGGSVDSFVAGGGAACAIVAIDFRALDPVSDVEYEEGSLVVVEYAGLNDVEGVELYDTNAVRLRAPHSNN